MKAACFERTGNLSALCTRDGEIDVESQAVWALCRHSFKVWEVFSPVDKPRDYSSQLGSFVNSYGETTRV